MPEIYVSTDVEADGPIPGPHSMLSFGSAAFLPDKTLLGTFAANLETLPGATAHPQTMNFWQSQPEAWAACRRDPQPPELVMPQYVAWLKALPGQPVFVAYPATYDFLFVYWYLIRFVGESPSAHHGLDTGALHRTPHCDHAVGASVCSHVRDGAAEDRLRSRREKPPAQTLVRFGAAHASGPG